VGTIAGSVHFDDILVVSLTSLGEERWVYKYNGPANQWDYAYSVTYGKEGNIYVAGSSSESNNQSKLIVISLTPNGGERWVYKNGVGAAYSITCGIDGNLYASGYRTVVSVTPFGQERWVYADSSSYFRSIVYGSDGNIYVAGGGRVVSLTSSGRERWVYRTSIGVSASLIAYGLDGNLYTGGTNYIGRWDWEWVIMS